MATDYLLMATHALMSRTHGATHLVLQPRAENVRINELDSECWLLRQLAGGLNRG
jgi:hypothetical protein